MLKSFLLALSGSRDARPSGPHRAYDGGHVGRPGDRGRQGQGQDLLQEDAQERGLLCEQDPGRLGPDRAAEIRLALGQEGLIRTRLIQL